MANAALITAADLTALFGHDRQRADEARESIHANPSYALTLVDQGRTSGSLSLFVQSRMVEEILGEVSDLSVAREILEMNMSSEATAEILGVRADLPSVLAQLASPEVIIAALLEDVQSGHSPRKKDETTLGFAEIALTLMAWAENLKERPDWEELLDHQVGSEGNYTLRNCLLAAVLYEAGKMEDLTPGHFEDLGLDPDEALAQLVELVEVDGLPKLTDDDVAEAQKRLRAKRQEFEGAEADLATAADAAADDIEI